MKKLLFVIIILKASTLNAQNDTLRISLNLVRGALYGTEFDSNLNPSIFLNYKSFLIGMPIPKQYEVSSTSIGPTIESKRFELSAYIGYEMFDDFFTYFSLGRFGQKLILMGENDSYTIATNRLGLGAVYMSDKKHYTIGVDMRGTIVEKEILHWNPTLTIGLNFTTADFKKFINFIK